jgi:hypothetical protein
MSSKRRNPRTARSTMVAVVAVLGALVDEVPTMPGATPPAA